MQGVTDYAIFMLDPAGKVANWNAGARRIKGWAAEEIVGQHFSRFYTEEDRAAGVRGERWRGPSGPGGSRPRAGACARTAPASGPAW